MMHQCSSLSLFYDFSSVETILAVTEFEKESILCSLHAQFFPNLLAIA